MKTDEVVKLLYVAGRKGIREAFDITSDITGKSNGVKKTTCVEYCQETNKIQ